MESPTATGDLLVVAHKPFAFFPAPAPPARQPSTRQYIELARPLLVKRLLTQLDRIAAHAGTPEAGVYVYGLERLVAQALEQFFDDGFLSLLLAVRNVLAGENAWMRLSTEQIHDIQDLVRRYADKPFDNGLIFRRAVLELRKLGLETSPVELPEESWGDDET
jgi:hypothetical protein